MSLILLDQDGVVADFEGGFLAEWQRRHGDLHPGIPLAQRQNFHLRGDYPVELHEHIGRIQQEAGFFRRLPPIPGALDAARQLSVTHDVFICTSPLSGNRYCPSEKFEWVEEHLGSDWLRRVILTKDKTVVHGDVLVDDKPEVVGIRMPSWHHVVYDAPYNRGMTTAPRLMWQSSVWWWTIANLLRENAQ